MSVLRAWISKNVVRERLNNRFGLVLLIIVSLVMAFLLGITSNKVNALVVVFLAGAPVVLYAVQEHKFALYFLMVISAFSVMISRLLAAHIPYGIFIDMLLLLIAFMSISDSRMKKKDDSLKGFWNPITVLIMIWVAYWLIQFFNPEGTLSGWMYGIRRVIRMLVIYFVLWKLLDDIKAVKQFTKFYIILSLLVCAYGLYQEYGGFPAYDYRWVTANEERIQLFYVGGKWRKFASLADPSAFGLYMALMMIFTAIFAAEAKTNKRRIILLVISLLSALGMFAAGIRTAYVVVPIGIMLYVLLNINNVRTLVFAGAAVLLFAVVYFGPFYNKTIVRFRTAFNPQEDASFQLRDFNRARIQPYIYSHPLGGGLSTTGVDGDKYAPSHFLAGFPPDSGFMKTLLELGWIGLAFEISLYLTILIIGVNQYYRSKSREVKVLIAAYLIGFFGLTVAYYAKKNVDQFPINFFLYATAVFVVKLKNFDHSSDKELSSDT